MIEYEELLFNDEKELISFLKFSLNEVRKKVKTLTEELTEKEKENKVLRKKKIKNIIAFLEESYKMGAVTFKQMFACNWIDENVKNTCFELEQQLAEKEKELHYKDCECEKWKRDYENCSRPEKRISKERQYCLDNWRASEHEKISFCIEKLQDVKKFCENWKNTNDCYEYVIIKETSGIRCVPTLYEELDEQIELLKKEQNNENTINGN